MRFFAISGLLLAACVSTRTPAELRVPPASPPPQVEARHPCDPIATREPIATDGGVCGDGVRGQRCELFRTDACGTSSEAVRCEAPELCEGNDLGGATCATIGLSGTGLACAPGCQFFDDSRCDACPRRPGVTCQTLGLPKGLTAHTFSVAPDGVVAALTIDDAMKVRLHILRNGRLVRSLSPLPKHDPRHLVAIDAERFVYVTEEYGQDTRSERVVAVPFSARTGVGAPIELLKASDVRVQAAAVVDGVPLFVSFIAGSAPPQWNVHALSREGRSMELPEGRLLVAFLRFMPELAVLRDHTVTTIVALPNNGASCQAVVVQRGPDGVVQPLSGGPQFQSDQLGTITSGLEGSHCRATWKHPDGTVTVLGQRPPPMQGVEDWKHVGSKWLGERQGVLLTVDPLEFR